MIDKPARAPQARTFVVRVVMDEHAGIHGQASEPGSPDEWRVTVASLTDLWDRLEQRLTLVLADLPAERPPDRPLTDLAG